MKQVEMIESIIEPLVQSGIYKDGPSALKAVIIDYIDRKRSEYDGIISFFEKKYQKNFDAFSRGITGRAGIEDEDDWMEWKGAIEMRKGWDEAYRLSIHGQAV
jgi:hypothetical protein